MYVLRDFSQWEQWLQFLDFRQLSYQASVLLDNRYGLIVATTVRAPSGLFDLLETIDITLLNLSAKPAAEA